MTELFASALFIVACTFAIHAMPADQVARHVPVPPSFDIAMPAAAESPEALRPPVAHAAVGHRAANGQ